MRIGWALISAVIGFVIAKRLTRKRVTPEKPASALATERLMQIRNQTMRLRELSTLNDRLEGTNKESESLEKSVKRLELILNKLDHLVSTNQSAQSESLLTRFSKHLRHLLHEGASPAILLHENLEYLEGSLSLMAAMNQHSWAFEIDDDGLAEIDINRKIQSISLTAWIFEMLWESVINDGIKSSVIVVLNSDTYKLKVFISVNENEMSTEIPLLP
jgi:hypothetical protein